MYWQALFWDDTDIVPVKLEVKEFTKKDNILYVAIAPDNKKTDEVVTQGNTIKGVTKQYARSSVIISIADFLKKSPLKTEIF